MARKYSRKKKPKFGFWVGVVLLVLILSFSAYFGFQGFNVVYDDYRVYDSFTLQPPALARIQTITPAELNVDWTACSGDTACYERMKRVYSTDEEKVCEQVPYETEKVTYSCSSGTYLTGGSCTEDIGIGSPCCGERASDGSWKGGGQLIKKTETITSYREECHFEKKSTGEEASTSCTIQCSQTYQGSATNNRLTCTGYTKTCSDDKWQISGNSWTNRGCYGATASFNNFPTWSATGGQTNGGVFVTSDLIGQDIKALIEFQPLGAGYAKTCTPPHPASSMSLYLEWEKEDGTTGVVTGTKTNSVTEWNFDGSIVSNVGVPNALYKGTPTYSLRTLLIDLYHSRLDENRYYVTINGIEVGYLEYPDDAKIKLVIKDGYGGHTHIKEVKTRPIFNCEVYQGEGLVFDVYDSGSLLWLSDDYKMSISGNKVLKFCLTNAPKILSETEGGLTVDERGEILTKLVQGEKITIPENQIYYIYYITDITGLDGYTACGVGEAWNTGTQECNSIDIQKEAPDPIQITRVTEQPVVGAVPFSYQFYYQKGERIGEGEDSVRLYDVAVEPFFIAESQFKSGDLTYLGEIPESQEARDAFFDSPIPSPSADRWQTTFSFEGDSYIVKHGDKVSLNKYLDVEFRASGRYREQDEWKNNYYFSFTNLTFLDVDIIQQPEPLYIVRLDSEGETVVDVPFKVFYDLTNTGVLGGIVVKEKTNILFREQEFVIPFRIKKGWNNYNYQWKVQDLGTNLITIQPYIEIAGTTIYSPNEAVYLYYVKPRSEQQDVVEETAEEILEELEQQQIVVGGSIEEGEERTVTEMSPLEGLLISDDTGTRNRNILIVVILMLLAVVTIVLVVRKYRKRGGRRG